MEPSYSMTDAFEGVKFTWASVESEGRHAHGFATKALDVNFDMEHTNLALGKYIPFIWPTPSGGEDGKADGDLPLPISMIWRREQVWEEHSAAGGTSRPAAMVVARARRGAGECGEAGGAEERRSSGAAVAVGTQVATAGSAGRWSSGGASGCSSPIHGGEEAR